MVDLWGFTPPRMMVKLWYRGTICSANEEHLNIMGLYDPNKVIPILQQFLPIGDDVLSLCVEYIDDHEHPKALFQRLRPILFGCFGESNYKGEDWFDRLVITPLEEVKYKVPDVRNTWGVELSFDEDLQMHILQQYLSVFPSGYSRRIGHLRGGGCSGRSI